MSTTQLGEFDGGSIAIEENAGPVYRIVIIQDGTTKSFGHATATEAAHAAAKWIRDNWENAPDDTWHSLNRLVSDDLAARGLREYKAQLDASNAFFDDKLSSMAALDYACLVQEELASERTRMANMINRGTVRGVDPRAVVVEAAEYTVHNATNRIASAWSLLVKSDKASTTADCDELVSRALAVIKVRCRWPEGDYSYQMKPALLRAELQREADMGPEALYWQRAEQDPGRALGEDS